MGDFWKRKGSPHKSGQFRFLAPQAKVLVIYQRIWNYMGVFFFAFFDGNIWGELYGWVSLFERVNIWGGMFHHPVCKGKVQFSLWTGGTEISTVVNRAGVRKIPTVVNSWGGGEIGQICQRSLWTITKPFWISILTPCISKRPRSTLELPIVCPSRVGIHVFKESLRQTLHTYSRKELQEKSGRTAEDRGSSQPTLVL